MKTLRNLRIESLITLAICVLLLTSMYATATTPYKQKIETVNHLSELPNMKETLSPKDTQKKVAILEWKGPYGSFADYRKGWKQTPFSAEIIGNLPRDDGPNQPLVLVIVNTVLYEQIPENITRYVNDLETYGGYNTILVTISGGTVEDLKNQILTFWNQGCPVVGAVMIGSFPTAWFHHEWDFYKLPAEFPCDLFLMDLDGLWLDTNNDGKYDNHTDGTGDTAPEIYLGRIDASNVSGDEALMTQQYLDKVHQFWIGALTQTGHALSYTDQNWTDDIDIRQGISYAYPSYDEILYPEVTAPDYRSNRLPNEIYEFIQIACHSSSDRHQFTTNQERLYSNDVRNAHPQALFYNLFACGALRFTDYNCLGNAYIINTSSPSLTVIGSTKSGSMLDFQHFYIPLSQGFSFGSAFQHWFASQAPYQEAPEGNGSISWFYGMTILGDPTLVPKPIVEELTADANGPYTGYINEPIQFNGTATGGKIPYTFHWDFGDETASDEQNPTHVYSKTGVYTVTLTVTDKQQNIAINSTTVNVMLHDLVADNHGPYTGYVDIPLQFIGSAVGGLPEYSYYWDFGDDECSYEQNPTHFYTLTNIYIVTLTVTDLLGNIDESITTATITLPPIHNINKDTYYCMIQAAIDDSNPGDTIMVENGVYQEHLVITHSLTLLGHDTENTIIIGDDYIQTIFVTSTYPSEVLPDVTIQSFTIKSMFDYPGVFINNCEDIVLSNLIFSNVSNGIILYQTNHVTISKSHLIGGGWGTGIVLSQTLNAVIHQNVISGFSSTFCSGIAITSGSCNNTIRNNIIQGNYYGVRIKMDGSQNINNIIAHNNFIDNTYRHASDSQNNFWDNGYPSGGNYWSGFSGNDLFNGPYQNISGADGIIDTPYIIPDANHQDHYPLLQPFVLGDMNLDGIVNFGDINSFVLGMTQPAQYMDYYHTQPTIRGDINEDTLFDFGDINPFVYLLTNN